MIWKLHIGIPAELGSARLVHSWKRPVTAEDPMMAGAATVFVVTDIAKSTKHYRDVLGFAVTFEHGTPTFYVCLYRPLADMPHMPFPCAGLNRYNAPRSRKETSRMSI